MKTVITLTNECYYNSISLYRVTELAFDKLLKEIDGEYFVLLGYKNSTTKIFHEMVENKRAVEKYKQEILEIILEKEG